MRAHGAGPQSGSGGLPRQRAQQRRGAALEALLASSTRRSALLLRRTDAPTAGPGSWSRRSSYANEFTGQVSLTQTIFNGFLTQGNIAQARSQLALAFANLDSQKALTSFDLKTAFAQVVYAQQNVDIARNVIDIRQ